MKSEAEGKKKMRPAARKLLWAMGIFFLILFIAGIIFYYNFNRLLSHALMKSFNSTGVADIYELKFEKLSVSLLLGNGNIHVYNVELQPRVKPLHNYPYINSSFRLKTKKMLLANVELFTLIKENTLKLDRIEITEPEVEMKIDGYNYIFFPFKDSTTLTKQEAAKDTKPTGTLFLKEFDLVNASFHVTNSAREREFRIQKLNISLRDLMINQHPGFDIITNRHIDLSIGEFSGNLKKRAVKQINFKDYKVSIDSLDIQQTLDTVVYHFADFSTGLKMLDIQTADSIFHLTMQIIQSFL